jgi:hypothetical protein
MSPAVIAHVLSGDPHDEKRLRDTQRTVVKPGSLLERVEGGYLIPAFSGSTSITT